MDEPQPFRPHQTAAEMVVRLGTVAEVATTVDFGFPVLEIAWGSITVLIMPHSAAEHAPIAPCDVDRARDLHRAAGEYLTAMEALWAAQEAPDAAHLQRLGRHPDLATQTGAVDR